MKNCFSTIRQKTSVFLLLVFLLAAQTSQAGDYVLITLLHTNDLHGQIMPDGQPGLSKAVTLIRNIRTEMPNVLLLDAGDIIHDTYENYLSGGLASIAAMNAAGYMAAAAGNHEFDFGLPVLKNVMQTAAFPFIAANVKDKSTKGQWDRLAPYILITVRGVRIAVLGLTTTEVVSLHWPGEISDIRVDDPIETARIMVPEIKKQADVVVILSHLGFNNDKKLAASVPGIDFIIGGHSHTVQDKWQWSGNTLISQAGAFARYLGRIDFIVYVDEAGAKVVSVNGKDGHKWNDLPNPPLGKEYPESPLIPLDAALVDDPIVVSAYASYKDTTKAVLDRVIGEALDAIRAIPSDSGESPAGNLAADAVRNATNADIGIIDARSIASGLEKGAINIRSAFNIIGGFTRQQIITVRMSGSELQSALQAKLLKDGKLGVQLSGASVTYSPGKKNGTAVISNIMIDGKHVDPAAYYTLAGQAYIIQEIMALHPSAFIVSENGFTTREAIVQYIKSLGKVSPPLDVRIARLANGK